MLEQQISMFLILFGVAVIPFLARRLRIPSAALEIVYGMLLFNFLLRQRPDWFDLLRELGFIYLMFIAGMELDLRAIRKSGKSLWYVLVCLLSFVLTPLLFVFFGQSFYLGVAVAMISAGIVIPVLKELGLSRTSFGRDIVGVALTGELLSIVVLALIDAYHKQGLTLLAGLEVFKLVLLFALAMLVLRILYLFACGIRSGWRR
jgi:Kef-type K+ transport system membrane component KefB